MFLLYHAYVYLEFLILACTIYILAPHPPLDYEDNVLADSIMNDNIKENQRQRRKK